MRDDTGQTRSGKRVAGQYGASGLRPGAGDHIRPARLFKVAGLALIAASLAGCSMSRTAALETEDRLVTASVAKPVKAEGVDSTDAELIKSVVAEAEAANNGESVLAWSNPDTGSKGTIMAIDKFVGSHGQKCKKFQTTVDSFMGISIYNGETSELKKGFWVLSWFLRDGDD